MSAIDWATIKNGLWAYCVDVSNITWIWSNQDAPQPPYPYGVLDIPTGGDTVQQDELRFYPDTEETHAVGLRSFNVTLQVNVGPPDARNHSRDGRAILSDLQAAFRLPRRAEQLKAAGVSIYNESTITQLSLVVADTWISRAELGLECYAGSCSIEAASDFFNRVKLSSDYTNASDDLNLTDKEIAE
jgi:hypothetical protein